MAWIYLAESADSLWPCHLGLGQLPTVKEIDSLKLCFCRGCGTVNFLEHLSGMTLPRSYLACCPEMAPSTSSMAGSHVRISVLLAAETAWRESEVDFSSKSHDSSLSFDPDSCSWKTSQLSLLEDFQPSSESLPGWGMTLGGRFFQPKMLEPIISDDDGFCLPTPMATPCGYQSQGKREKKYMIPQLWKMGKLPTPMARYWKNESQKSGMNRKSPSLPTYWKATTGTTMPVSFIEWIMGYHIGATALEGWATQWFRSKQGKRSKSSQDSRSKVA